MDGYDGWINMWIVHYGTISRVGMSYLEDYYGCWVDLIGMLIEMIIVKAELSHIHFKL